MILVEFWSRRGILTAVKLRKGILGGMRKDYKCMNALVKKGNRKQSRDFEK